VLAAPPVNQARQMVRHETVVTARRTSRLNVLSALHYE
jgi:hypothetical protein